MSTRYKKLVRQALNHTSPSSLLATVRENAYRLLAVVIICLVFLQFFVSGRLHSPLNIRLQSRHNNKSDIHHGGYSGNNRESIKHGVYRETGIHHRVYHDNTDDMVNEIERRQTAITSSKQTSVNRLNQSLPTTRQSGAINRQSLAINRRHRTDAGIDTKLVPTSERSARITEMSGDDNNDRFVPKQRMQAHRSLDQTKNHYIETDEHKFYQHILEANELPANLNKSKTNRSQTLRWRVIPRNLTDQANTNHLYATSSDKTSANPFNSNKVAHEADSGEVGLYPESQQTTASVQHNEAWRSSLSEAGASFYYHLPVRYLQNITRSRRGQLPLCPVASPDLVGLSQISYDRPSLWALSAQHPELEPGGRWRPGYCTSRHRVAIIVPFRDRQDHLRIFLRHMHPFLQRQQIDYAIFVVEQAGHSRFNRAMLMNIGYWEAAHLYDFQCFIFHDVDLLPEDDRTLYGCPKLPLHMSAAVNTMGYVLPYEDIFGGVVALTSQHFKLVNGFSNLFFGWGGEDDDFRNRVISKGLKPTRYPLRVARYKMMSHLKETPSDERFHNLETGPQRYQSDGINSLVYHMMKIEKLPLYTKIVVNIVEKEVMKTVPLSQVPQGLDFDHLEDSFHVFKKDLMKQPDIQRSPKLGAVNVKVNDLEGKIALLDNNGNRIKKTRTGQ